MREEHLERVPILRVLRDLGRPVFTTRELASLKETSLSSASQILGRLARSGLILRLSRGLWCDPQDPRFSALAVVPFLLATDRGYVSFITALHLNGVMEQIPQVIQVATTGHGRRVVTPVGTFEFHRIDPRLFGGFDWSGDRQQFLMASPEKALVDCLYLSTRRGRRFGSFPELSFPRGFSPRRARQWARRIPDPGIRGQVLHKLETVLMAFPRRRTRRGSSLARARTGRRRGGAQRRGNRPRASSRSGPPSSPRARARA